MRTQQQIESDKNFCKSLQLEKQTNSDHSFILPIKQDIDNPYKYCTKCYKVELI